MVRDVSQPPKSFYYSYIRVVAQSENYKVAPPFYSFKKSSLVSIEKPSELRRFKRNVAHNTKASLLPASTNKGAYLGGEFWDRCCHLQVRLIRRSLSL